MSRINEPQLSYKPHYYQWALDAVIKSQDSHWTYDESPVADDLAQYRNLPKNVQSLVNNILFFFTNGDMDVRSAYVHRFPKMFLANELQMMFSEFAGREVTHILAYALLNESLGLPDSDFERFINIPEMYNKHAYLESFFEREIPTDPLEQYKEVAIFSLFTEGFSLFSSFGTLISFSDPKVNLLLKIKNIIAWSIIDEEHHFSSMLKVCNAIKEENPSHNWDAINSFIRYNIVPTIIENEFAFVDYIFKDITPEDNFHLNVNNVKNYLAHIMIKRCNELGIDTNNLFVEYNVDLNDTKLLYLVERIVGSSASNFFTTKVTQYNTSKFTGNNNFSYPMD